MGLDTEWVNRKLKVVVPSAGLSMPSIFCSTSGPTSVVEVLVSEDDHGQPKGTCGRGALTPNRCSAPDSTASAAQAAIRRNTASTTTISTVHRSQRGIREYQRRRGYCGP